MPLKEILMRIEQEVEARERFKDELYDGMRKATRLSKQAIFLVHKRRITEAKKILEEAGESFTKLDDIPPVHQELRHAGIVHSAYQEYSEAHIFLNLVEEATFIAPERINTPSVSYLLGLADVVGELRRKALDALRDGDVNTAEGDLETMELIHNEIMGMDEALHGVSELRRKTDVARRIIESTRGDVTVEVRRTALERSIEKLETALQAGEK
jgi:translin